MKCRQGLLRAPERGRDLDEASRIGARECLCPGGEHVAGLAVSERPCRLRLHEVVDPGRAAAELLLSRLDELELGDAAE